MLVPLVQPWIPLVCTVLASDPSARASWPTKLAALRLGQALANYFSKPLAAAMPQLMGAAWQLLLALQVGVRGVVLLAGVAARPAWCAFYCAQRAQRADRSVPCTMPVTECLVNCCCAAAALPCVQPLHQSLLVEGQEDEAEEAAAESLGADDELVGLEPLLAQASRWCASWHSCMVWGVRGSCCCGL